MTEPADLKARILANPEARAEYDAQAPEFELARELITARTRAGLTQSELAERMHTTQSTIARLEENRGLSPIFLVCPLFFCQETVVCPLFCWGLFGALRLGATTGKRLTQRSRAFWGRYWLLTDFPLALLEEILRQLRRVVWVNPGLGRILRFHVHWLSSC